MTAARLTCTKHFATSVAASREVIVVAIGAVEFVVLGGERLVNQGALAVTALETLLVPMAVLVRQILQQELVWNENDYPEHVLI